LWTEKILIIPRQKYEKDVEVTINVLLVFSLLDLGLLSTFAPFSPFKPFTYKIESYSLVRSIEREYAFRPYSVVSAPIFPEKNSPDLTGLKGLFRYF